MGSTTDRIKGTTNEAIGRFKRRLGKVTGSPALQGRGAILEAKGKGQKALGGIKRIVGRVTSAAHWPR
ncbi:CsbD family protein [Bradyrhizobium brasilense]|uniref:CsbD family protein n=1 Tax=Bradyrhizobium brasilense TaxID=1419277 RepID=UPI0024B1D375|nr:CsbD family protein [Bradyrhizobium australafricanum]WFU34730.1 CsbD family protein [Bradyrhizobium australafricanum]